MPKHKHHRPNKRRAITNALGQLGWQARGRDVIALLADYGIEVNEGLVSRVKVESLKKTDELKTKQARIERIERRRRTTIVRKVPQQRTYRR
jgi:hypothetical protein